MQPELMQNARQHNTEVQQPIPEMSTTNNLANHPSSQLVCDSNDTPPALAQIPITNIFNPEAVFNAAIGNGSDSIAAPMRTNANPAISVRKPISTRRIDIMEQILLILPDLVKELGDRYTITASEVLVALQRNGACTEMRCANAIGDVLGRKGFDLSHCSIGGRRHYNVERLIQKPQDGNETLQNLSRLDSNR